MPLGSGSLARVSYRVRVRVRARVYKSYRNTN